MANQITSVFSSGIDFLKEMSLQKKAKLGLFIVGFLGLSVGLSFGSKFLFARFNLPIFDVAWLTYLIVFVAFFTIELVPFGLAPIALYILFVTAPVWNPLMEGLAAAIGASVGGFGGYFMGILGRRVLLKENFMCSINEVLCNKNIWKYSSKCPNARIEFGVKSQGNKEVYFVMDNGVGFDMKRADKLFTPFQRLHSDYEYAGTGIGLAIAQRVVQRHGGRIWAESETGKGATFFFTLN
jgi:hypothetical protein